MKALENINQILDTHCKGCLVYQEIRVASCVDEASRNCLHKCRIGKRLQALGRRLEREYKAMKKQRRMKSVSRERYVALS